MSAPEPSSAGRAGSTLRLIIFGVTGHLGQELVERLDESDWPIAELVGVASADSVGNDFEFRGDELEVVDKAPALKGRDLVLICTRGVDALEIVRDCLKSEVPCIDLTGALSAQIAVPMPLAGQLVPEEGAEDALASAPLIGLPSSTTLSWTVVLEALLRVAPVVRATGTVLCSASANGHRGLVALSEESIALFNQSEPPSPGPAGQAVAFDVVPGGGVDCDRIRGELARTFGEALRVDVASVQVPTFVGEGTSLFVQFAQPVDGALLEAELDSAQGITRVAEGHGSRGLVAIEPGEPEPIGPTLRDVSGIDEVLVGRIEGDASMPDGQGWHLWLASDPLRIAAAHALQVAGRRLGLG
jgi:aspartate-semialdehyde dehydrogenase